MKVKFDSECILKNGVEAYLQMRTIEALCKELSGNKEVPTEMIPFFQETAKRFKAMVCAYSRGRGFSTKTNAASIKHCEEAYRHLEEAVEGPGSGFTTKLVKFASRKARHFIDEIVFRSHRKVCRLAKI